MKSTPPNGGTSVAIPCFCLDAIDNYRKAGKTAKVRGLEQQYGELAGSVRLGKTTICIDQAEAIKRGRELAEKVAKWQPQQVISFLIHQQELLPQYADIKKKVTRENIEPILIDMVSTTIDDRGHASRHFSTDDERLFRLRAQTYGQELECYKLPVIRIVLVEAIKEGKLSHETAIKFLWKKSWLGRTLTRKSPTHGTRQYRWLDLLEPSLGGYTSKVLQSLRDGTRVPHLVLEIDSLTVKFEGILRDLLRIAGVPTFRPKSDRKGRTTTEEKHIGELLYDKSIGSLFEENELFFLRFLLVEKSGYNLRARIAHSLMLAEDYHLDYAHMLVLALLMLASMILCKTTK
ncbi:MAG: DUF4209 domain-containing protein [Phycisphaerae bacterium]|nr:DUF4209 domain-containing protein [Phycisphaerae bacterium]